MKARHAREAVRLIDIPNVGPVVAEDFRIIGITTPHDLVDQDPLALYRKLCLISGVRHDPCVLDTFMAVTDFMNGAPARPWFFYTKNRKKQFPDL